MRCDADAWRSPHTAYHPAHDDPLCGGISRTPTTSMERMTSAGLWHIGNCERSRNAWIERHTMRGSQKSEPNITQAHEDAEDDDPAGQYDQDCWTGPAMPIMRMNRPMRFFCVAKTCSTNAGIYDLSTHGQIAQALEVGVKAGKQGIDGIGADQGLAEPPERRLVGRVVVIVEAKEAPEAAPAEDLELGLRI